LSLLRKNAEQQNDFEIFTFKSVIPDFGKTSVCCLSGGSILACDTSLNHSQGGATELALVVWHSW